MSPVAPAPPEMQREEPSLTDPAACPCLKLSELHEGDLVLLMSRSFAGNFIGTFGTGISHIGIVVEYGGKLWLAQSVTNPLSMGAKQMIAIADLPSPLREARPHPHPRPHPRTRAPHPTPAPRAGRGQAARQERNPRGVHRRDALLTLLLARLDHATRAADLQGGDGTD